MQREDPQPESQGPAMRDERQTQQRETRREDPQAVSQEREIRRENPQRQTSNSEPARRGDPTTDTTPADFRPNYSKPPRSQAARGAAAASGSREPASDAPNLRAGPQRQSSVRRAAADDRRAASLSEDSAASARRKGGRDAATSGQAIAAAGEGR